jgi:hypothetical protein
LYYNLSLIIDLKVIKYSQIALFSIRKSEVKRLVLVTTRFFLLLVLVIEEITSLFTLLSKKALLIVFRSTSAEKRDSDSLIKINRFWSLVFSGTFLIIVQFPGVLLVSASIIEIKVGPGDILAAELAGVVLIIIKLVILV